MSVRSKGYPVDLGGSFTEDAPRPPVPGEEGELVATDSRQYSHSFYSTKSEASTATPRRPDLDLGYEPEGSASPTPPYLKWAESLHSLLDDQDGTHLFRTFLKQEDCADLLDFWFACSGFRKLEASGGNEEKKLKLAKAIYKKYILDNNSIVSRQIKAATKSFIRDCVVRVHIEPAMLDQAQTEIQAMLEENTYPVFLKSDLYLEYTRTGGESPKLCPDHSSGSGTGMVQPGYLPTLNEDEEWKCDQHLEEPEGDPTPTNRLTQKLLLETASQRAASNKRSQDSREYRHGTWREPVNPYYVNTGYAMAPATSANDSEQQSLSSDADSLSLTDSSVDGIPPYRFRKLHRREMQESAKANGRVPLPHMPRTYRIPKDIHVEPQKFAAELSSRLEGVLREREAQEKLEERLKRVRMEEEGDDADVSAAPSLVSHKLPPVQPPHHFNSRYSDMSYSGMQLRDAHEENPESILDEHVQRVMKTPGCHSPKSRSPDGLPAGKHPSKPGLKAEGAGMYHHKHVYHHTHHHGTVKPKEQPEGEASQRGQSNLAWNGDPHHYATKSRNYADSMGMAPNPMDSLGHSSKGSTLSKRASKKAEPLKTEDSRNFEMPAPPEDMERNQKILQWMMEGEKESGRHKKTPYGSTGGVKKVPSHEPSRPSSIERPGAVHPWVTAQLRNNVQPSHPFIQDPTMPPNPAPNPLTQLEEARRRLEEERKRAAPLQAKQRHRTQKKQPCESLVVAYYFCGEPIPYRTSVKGRVVTLGQFKELLTKKGSYRYYFKKVSDEFDCGVVFEEVREDDAILPIFEEKIIGKVEKID
ncbi:axin-1-like isoform X1 [Acipenser ruthenus]|uniref:axin-1-like isoform X1 n=1 Tax=Acipenser ruthenus TaxID=7906 RepID=UPI0015608B18|nr:axin-1-like isoform X1 [Acipenser ruthenus]XP_034781864.1 axin-1-like isoform X1 [Acipenser ruthenus]XP_034781866.1 axin-1-like isoform X1 [Acipenser ruthenus]XP_058891306.1 axin-1-like isoform X1 [Acipenser ruthenus]